MLRSALALSASTAQPFTIHNIRAGRKTPGLLRQHLTCVEAVASICKAKVDGATPGSTTLTFIPGTMQSGTYKFAVGTAGSAVLVLQTLIQAWIGTQGDCEAIVEGGTHNSAAPPFDHLALAYIPVLRRMGLQVEAKLERHGFYPAGGGRIRLHMNSSKPLRSFDWGIRGAVTRRQARILAAHLPDSVGARQATMLKSRLGWADDQIQVENCDSSVGPGNAVIAELHGEDWSEVITGFGARGIPSGKVIDNVVSEVREYMKSTAPVGEHLGDQLMVPFALMGAGSYRAIKASMHARTNAHIIEAFLPGRVAFEDTPDPTDGTWFRFSKGSA